MKRLVEESIISRIIFLVFQNESRGGNFDNLNFMEGFKIMKKIYM